ncbi:hypothetical protein [Aestuariispira ectoiniformans]|uniref:hypothetical protein n=1 Tax=Aestuariispira ectoiniformans TaxID=2775080 RepID=UPI00223B0A15|nr:hypothetical protein [Aestuariispira ectoiniformans]
MYREPLPEKYRILAVKREIVDVASMALTSRDQIATEVCRSLYDWWEAAAGDHGGEAPWASFDIVDHRELAPHLYLLKVAGEGESFEFSLHGEFPKRMFADRCWNKQSVAPDDDHPVKAKLYHHYYDSFIGRQPKRSLGKVCSEGLLSSNFESVDLPLFDTDGRVIRFIGAIDFL